MTGDEIRTHLDTLTTADGWAWIYAQPAAGQVDVLRTMTATSAAEAGMTPSAAAAYADQLVPHGADFGFGFGDPDAAWETALASVNAAASEMGRGTGFAAAFQGGAGPRAGGIGYSEDVSPTLISGGGSNQVPVILYEDED